MSRHNFDGDECDGNKFDRDALGKEQHFGEGLPEGSLREISFEKINLIGNSFEEMNLTEISVIELGFTKMRFEEKR